MPYRSLSTNIDLGLFKPFQWISIYLTNLDMIVGCPGLEPGTSRMELIIFLSNKEKPLLKPCLQFSLHTAFPMHTSKTQLLS